MPDPTMSQGATEEPALSEKPIEQLEDATAQLIDAALANEFPVLSDDEPTEEEKNAAPPEDEPQEASPPAKEAAKEPPAPEAPKEDDAAISRGLASLARKEKVLNDRERSVREAEIRAQQLSGQFEAFRRQALEDPVAFYKALGADGQTADIAAQLYVAQLGDKAPKELVEGLRGRQTDMANKRELEAIKRRLAEKEAAEVARVSETQAMDYLSTVVDKIPESLPYFKAEASDDRNLAVRAMYQRIGHLGRAGMIPVGASDDEIAAIAAKSLNDEIQRSLDRARRIHKLSAETKVPPPAAAPKNPPPPTDKKPPVTPRTLTKRNAVPNNAPKRAPVSEDEVISSIADEIRRL